MRRISSPIGSWIRTENAPVFANWLDARILGEPRVILLSPGANRDGRLSFVGLTAGTRAGRLSFSGGGGRVGEKQPRIPFGRLRAGFRLRYAPLKMTARNDKRP
jgi:hypothetical protein